MLAGPIAGVVMMMGAPVPDLLPPLRTATAITPPARYDLAEATRTQAWRTSPGEAVRSRPALSATTSPFDHENRVRAESDRFDLRALRLESGRARRARGPLDAGVQLRLTGDARTLRADLGVTGGVVGMIGKAFAD
jgi:hypothetical protein